ncbi:hypothetical protein ACUNV4_13650 [Granulosicoccus sp. 3-233]|uniref:hypothetical protein n=1 Tax=Granulosicoccus sp. 3-233 TaxID=3417969 RepID=UPI003D356889
MTQTNTTLHASELDVDLSDTHIFAGPALLGVLDTHMTLDPSQPGKQHGHLVLPYSVGAGLDHLRLPVCSIRGTRPGPTITLIGGVHGDEYEGALTLQRLARDLTPESVHGCLLIVPALNGAGMASATRSLPQTGEDLDLCFPGDHQGTLGERLAREVFERLIRPAELVLDLRSGGQRLQFAASAAVRSMGVPNGSGDGIGEAAMIAFGAPNSVRLPASAGRGCLQATVEAAGKAYVQSELGGGGGCTRQALEIASVGCRNVLRHMGVLNEEVQLRASRMLEVRDHSFFVHAPVGGLLEPFTQPGGDVWQGDTLACLVNLEQSADEPCRIAVPRNGVLLALHHGGPVRAGELIGILADEVQR